MLRWLRRRWRRWSALAGCLFVAAVLAGSQAGQGLGGRGGDDHDKDYDRRQEGHLGPPLAANAGFRKSLQAFQEKDSQGLPMTDDHHRDVVNNSAVLGRPSDSQGPSLPSPPRLPEEPPFRVYVYDLPARFNANLTACAAAGSDGCYKLTDHGMGPELRRHDYLSYRDTHQLSLEIILHEKMLASRHRTTDASEADAFYVPFYAALACSCKGQSDLDLGELYEDLWRHLQSASPYFGSSGPPRRPHFMALARVERDFWTGNCPLLRDTERTEGITFIGVERELNEELRKYFKRTRVRMVVAPYPSYGHLDSAHTATLWPPGRSGAFPADIRQSARDVRVFMAVGSRKGHDIRVILKRSMTGTSQRYSAFTASSSKQRRYAVWYSTPECRPGMQLPTLDWMRHAVFCLQPPGESLTRKSFYDAVLAGCIPVTFKPRKRSAAVAYPFQDRLDYGRFTVNIPADDVLAGSVRVLDRLRLVPESRVADMQRRLAQAAASLQYSHPPGREDRDAFSMIVDEMRRIAA